jgi:type IV secretion system protein VirB5
MKKFTKAAALCWLLLLTATATAPANATMPVIDVAAITQLLQQIMAWDEQLQGMRAQLGQLRETTSALTGARGMEQLLRQTPAARNYLPTDWTGLASIAGGAAVDPALARAARAQRDANAVLPAEALARLPPPLQSLLRGERDAVAASQAVSRAAYTHSSDRFAPLTTLIDQIRAAPDAKAIADLQSRIEAEQAMLTNESIKLVALAQVTDAERSARELARREVVLQSHGAFGARFQPAPPVP